MTKIRKNHSKDKGGTSLIVRVILFCVMLIWLLNYIWGKLENQSIVANSNFVQLSDDSPSTNNYEKNLLPVSTTGEVIDHGYYTLSYSEEHEQAEWVAYNLTKESIQVKNVDRETWYEEDKKVKNGSALHKDYSGSGYSRGHLIPAGDLAFSTEAMKASMYMSNMSPQLRAFNGGVWNELENQVRNWAYDRGEVYVVTGPILTRGNIITTIGDNEVAVPKSFYKIVLDYDHSPKEAIAFIIPNEKSEKRLETYAVSIDQVEDITGIDFFADYMDSSEEDKVESTFDIKEWEFDENLYLQRVNSWNNQ